jgi:predicted dehydrogenase
VSAQAPLRAAVIGCGAIAYEHLPFLASSAAAELTAVCDRSPALAHAAAQRFGPAAEFTDVGVMLAEVRPDVVHVLTPPQTHDQIVRAALAAGAHVICEKPMAANEAETAGLLDAAAQAGRVLVESRNLLWNDPMLQLVELIRAGDLGQVVECDLLMTVDFLSGPFGDPNLAGPGVALPGGAVHDFLPHLVFGFQALTGARETRDLRGFLMNRSGNPRAGFDFLDVLVDAGTARGRLRLAADAYPAAFEIVVRGTKGTVSTDIYNPFLLVSGDGHVGKRAPLGLIGDGGRLIRAGARNLRDKIMQHGPMHGMGRMLDAIYQALRAGDPPPIRPEDMLASARLCDRVIALGEPS